MSRMGVSGIIYSSITSGGYYTEPMLMSGASVTAFTKYEYRCAKCNKLVYSSGTRRRPYIVITYCGKSNFYKYYCAKCIDYDPDKGLETRKDWILESVDFVPGTPLGIIADYLQDQGRTKDAEYLRSLDK